MNRSPTTVKATERRAALLERLTRLRNDVDAMRAELAELLPAGDEYFTSKSLPPGVSRRTFRSVCASGRVAGAKREGHTWIAPRDAWFAARRRDVKPAKAATAPLDPTAEADRLIEAAGLRSTRSA